MFFQDDKDLVPTRATQLTEPESSPNQTEALVQSALKQLVKRYKEGGRREPVCYFSFVIDPDSFGRTVENVFHVSFLVKEGKVRDGTLLREKASLDFPHLFRSKSALIPRGGCL